MKILVALPCYNCASQIPRALEKLFTCLEVKYDVLILDNGSSDITIAAAIEKLRSLPKRGAWRVCKNEQNYGLGGSQKLGIKAACEQDYEVLVVLHGDDQAEPGDISRLLEVYRKNNCSVLGSRFMRGSVLRGYQRTRILGNRSLNILFSLFCFRPIRDLGSGLNLFRVEDLKALDIERLSDGFNFNVDLLLSLIENEANFQFEPIHWSETDQVSNARNFQVASSMLKSLLMWRSGLRCRHRSGDELKTRVIASDGV